MKIFCVYLCDYNDRNDYYMSLMPYGITSIAAFLEKCGHDVTLANLSSYGFSKGAALTLKNAPDVVAVSIFSFNRTESFKYIKELKKKNSKLKIIAGGQHPTFLSEQIQLRYPEIDFIIRGEGELAIKKILDLSFKTDNSIITAERIADIDSIPCASQFSGITIGINPNEQYRYIITSRGCPSNCTYCSSPYFWEKKVTYRSAEKIIDELKLIRQKYGIIYFSIRDDNFTLNKKRVMEFCHMLDNSRLYMMWNCQARVDTIDEEMLIAMKRCGLEHIQYGVESGSEKILALYDKRISIEKIKSAAAISRKVGVYLSYYLMTGMTGETTEDIEYTKKLISETKPHDVVVSPVAYYPGTKIYSDSIKKKKINDNIWFDSAINGLYLSDMQNNNRNIQNILSSAGKISLSANYNTKDFKIHRQTTGRDCWMNNVIEGDHYSGMLNITKATDCYKTIISEHPENCWGYLRLAELICDQHPQNALKLLDTVTELVPLYYGTWYSKARLQYHTGDLSGAKYSIKKALEYNSYDPQISKFSEKINKNKLK